MRRIVLPGDKIADKAIRIPNTFIDDNVTYAAVIGMLDEDGTYIPLEARYKPAVEDVVIGLVMDVRPSSYNIDINLPFSGFLSGRDLRIRLNIGDVIMCRVKSVDEVGNIDLEDARILPKGKIIEFPPSKVPRLIGRKSSMLNILKEAAGGEIIVGNNGYVWISEISNIPLLLRAMNRIIQKAHISGLTDNISQFLNKELKANKGEY